MEVQTDRGIFVMFTVNKPRAEGASSNGLIFGDEKETGALIDEAFDGHGAVTTKSEGLCN